MNCRRRSDNRSGFKGVTFYKKNGTWQADIQLNGKQIYLGRYASPQEAAKVYDAAALEYFGEFACINHA
jgi:hypothetical protein